MSNSEDLKLLVASEVEKYPCLWKKQDRSHKNLQRRNNAWENVAKTLNIQVTEAKKIWKSVKDARRYHKQRKMSGKSGDAASESEDSVDGTELSSATQFLDEGTAENLRSTVSLGGEEVVSPDEDGTVETSSAYSYANASTSSARKRRQEASNDPAVDAAHMINQTLKEYMNRSTSTELQHAGLWMEVESYFKEMDSKTVRNLKMKILNLVHEAWTEEENKKV